MCFNICNVPPTSDECMNLINLIWWYISRLRYSTALSYSLWFIIFLTSHVNYTCYFLLSMYRHQCNAEILSHVISYQLPETVIPFYNQSCARNQFYGRQMVFIPMLGTLSLKDSMTLFFLIPNTFIPGCGTSGYDLTCSCLVWQFTNLPYYMYDLWFSLRF